MSRPITDAEREVFDAIRRASNMALVQTEFDGEETAVICAIVSREDGEVEVTPVAVLLTADMFDKVTPPSDDFVEK